MFEGVVSQVLAGYLGRYFKGIQKDQLKIGIWNEEILLEEIDLNLESFDYLQLPFALKQGRIGKLSIRIPWKKLGWDSINIILEDVFVCACRRDENEWTSGSVEKRELSAKMAKLNAAELAKFSNRICGHQAGQSFITYITTKILDNIQVYIQNVHLVYIDVDNDLVSREIIVFGLRLDNLTVKTDQHKQNYTASYHGKSKGGHVTKAIEISNLGIYCNLIEGNEGSFDFDYICRSLSFSTTKTKNELNNYLLSPFNVTISLLVNKSAKLDDCPLYMLAIDLASLVILLDDDQLRQLLVVWDVFSICKLREKYGRYRPTQKSRKTHGWQRKWWHYAQEAILSDVRLKLRKTSWRNLGWRMTCRRKYVNLYKRKLEFIQQDQTVDDDIIHELEQIEKACDVEDILNYRSTAEKLLMESLKETTASYIGVNADAGSHEKNVKNDELTSSRARSWLNWLSLGMLGAGGTTDSSFFSGVVSDEIIEDIYEATEFHPLHSLDSITKEDMTLFQSLVKFHVFQVRMTIASKRNGKQIAHLLCDGVSVECQTCEGKTEVMASIGSTKVVNPINENIMLVSRKTGIEEGQLVHHDTFINIQLVVPPGKQQIFSVLVTIQPSELTCEWDFLWNLVDFQHIFSSFEFHGKRVLSSLNGIEDTRTRLLLKTEYLLCARRRFKWEAFLNDIVIKIPLKTENSEYNSTVVLEVKSITCKSRPNVQRDPPFYKDDNFFGMETIKNAMPIEHFFPSLKQCDLYDHFELELSDFEGRINAFDSSHVATFVEKFNAYMTFGICVLLDEPLLRQLEVSFLVTSVSICLSPATYSTLARLLFVFSQKQTKRALHQDQGVDNDINNVDLHIFQYAIAVEMDCCTFQIKLGDDTEDCSVVCFILNNIAIRFSFEEFLKLIFHMKTIEVGMYTSRSKLDNITLCSSNFSIGAVPLGSDIDVNLPDNTSSEKYPKGNCYILHYRARRSKHLFFHEFNMWVHDIDVHIHPRFFGELQQLYDKLFGNQASPSKCSYYNVSMPNELLGVDLRNFGASDFYHTELSSSSSVPPACFPFFTVQNSDVLSNLNSSFTVDIQENDIPSLASQKSDVKKRDVAFNRSAVKSCASTNSCSESSLNAASLVMDVYLHGLRIYFHDSSCILGAISLPMCKFSHSFKETNCWDILFSADGLNLSSSLPPSNVQVLLGSVFPNVSSILNIHVRREKVEAANFPVTEVSFVIQHVNCNIPSEFLVMAVDYFALPDWSSWHNEVVSPKTDEVSKNDNVKPCDVVYKFEILDSNLLFPVEGMKGHYIQLGLPLVYCSFIPETKLSNSPKDFCLEDMSAIFMDIDRLDILSMFGHDISLLVLHKCDEKPMEFVESSNISEVILIEKLDAHLFIGMPCPTNHILDKSILPTIAVMKASKCIFVVKDSFLLGIEAVITALKQFSVFSEETQYFKSYALRSLQLKSDMTDSHNNLHISSARSLLEIKVTVKSFSLKLHDLAGKDAPSQVTAEAGMHVVFAASFKNGILVSLDVGIDGIVLHSFYSSVLLASVDEGPVPNHVWFNIFSSDQGNFNILFTVQSLEVWLHLSDWNRLIDLLDSNINKTLNGPSRGAIWTNMSQRYECQTVPYSLPNQVSDDSLHLTVKSENVSISFHLPLDSQNDSLSRFRKGGSPKLQDHALVAEKNYFPFKDNYQKFVKLIVKSKDIEFISKNGYVKLEMNVEKVRAVLEVMENSQVISMPFILISDVEVTAELMKAQLFCGISSEVKMNSVDVGLSYDVLTFWHGFQFITSNVEHPRISLSTINFSVNMQKGSVMLSDGKVKIMEILVKDALIKANKAEDTVDVYGISKLIVNYNNIDKVMWEPFIEPWSLQLNIDRKIEDLHLNLCGVTNILLKSTDSLNLNITEPLIEAIFRLSEVFCGAQKGPEEGIFHGSWGISQFPSGNFVHTKRHASYILYNGTSLPLSFWVSHDPAYGRCFQNYSVREENCLQPGSSSPIYVEEATDDLSCHWIASHPSNMYTDKRTSGIPHHMISIQIDGTSVPSKPMSMDLVGISSFEVKFSNSEPDRSETDRANNHQKMGTWSRSDLSNSLVVPVVFDVSKLCYSKLIRIYSTVILFNATSTPLELRFDIPLGISPKILGPILPLQEFPLPLHLAKTGKIRWRPVGPDYLWSDAQSLPNLLSKENKSGFLRSFVCYPGRPTSYPFRCCISVEDCTRLSRVFSTNGYPPTYGGSVETNDLKFHSQDSKWLIRHVKLTTPLLVRNCLPTGLSLTIDNYGVSHFLFLAEGDAASVFHVDSSHDLTITFHIKGFIPTMLKFPRSDSFMSMAKLNESKFSLSEALTFSPDTSGDQLLINVEKMMNAFSGARELSLSVPFLLYNCTGIPLAISYEDYDRKRHTCILPANYDLIGQEQFFDEENGLAILSSNSKLYSKDKSSVSETSTKNFAMPSQGSTSQHCHVLSRRCTLPTDSGMYSSWRSDIKQDSLDGFPCNLTDLETAASHSKYSSNSTSNQGIDVNRKKVKACMYSPLRDFYLMDLMVRLCVHSPHSSSQSNQSLVWSNPFCLVPRSGSGSVAIPRPCTAGAFLISITSDPAESLSGRTRSVVFQPRYVICNACSKDLLYKQKGTKLYYRLGVGQHSHFHWTDKTRELFISIRFNESGAQWSGSFFPDSLGDIQIKMRNYVSGTIDMVRVEVQNTTMSVCDENRVEVSSGTSGTLLILLSDDNTGFMPYKIDNYSLERLRVYQQQCEMFETTVHSYTSCQYAWDEPCYPQRLVIEVPGERVLGAYNFDDVKDYMPVCLPQTSEKPERTLFVGVHAEGATKVLSIIDSNYHSLKDIQESTSLGFNGKRKFEDKHVDITERMEIQLPFIGVSLIDSSPQELIFASAKSTTMVFLQNAHQQRISIWLKSLQIDNQLHYTPYPVILSFDHALTHGLLDSKNETILKIQEENSKGENPEIKTEYVFHLLAAKWRVKERPFVSFEYLILRMSPLHVYLEGQVLANLLDLFKSISTRLSNGVLQPDPEMQIFDCYTGGVITSATKGGTGSGEILSIFPNLKKKDESHPSISPVVPIGAPWQQIFHLAGKKKKIYIEVFELAPISFTLSFSSTPWTTREGCDTQEPLPHFSSTKFQRGLMALVDIEGVPVHLGGLTLLHLMTSLESIQAILTRHYTRQLLHEMYKVFGSVGVIGNPIGFLRNFQLGLSDFLSVFGKGIVQSPSELIAGVAQGSKSLLSNTVYAVSSATSQFSKAAHKGIIAFMFDEESMAKIEKQRKRHDSPGKGILNEFFEGLTGLLQSPIRGAEEHGLPGFLSGIALGSAGLIARPVAGILEATGKTAQSIRNRSGPHQPSQYRVRLPRPVARDFPLLPYSWEEAIGTSVLLEADGTKLKEETLVLCKSLKLAGRFIIITCRLVLDIWCSNLVGLGSLDFVGIADPEWVIEMKMSLESIIHMDRSRETINIVGSNKETFRQKRPLSKSKQRTPPTSLPLSHMSIQLQSEEEAEEVFDALHSLNKNGEIQGKRSCMLLRSSLRL